MKIHNMAAFMLRWSASYWVPWAPPELLTSGL